MTYDYNLSNSSEWKDACLYSNKKNRVFRKGLREIKKEFKGFSKLNNENIPLCDKSAYEKASVCLDKYKEFKGWLLAKTRGISYGSMYQQQDGRVVFHKDRRWAKRKIVKLEGEVDLYEDECLSYIRESDKLERQLAKELMGDKKPLGKQKLDKQDSNKNEDLVKQEGIITK
jgi:hypothetical protein